MSGKKIVLADDEPDMLEVYGARLSLLGYNVIPPANGRDALAQIRAQKPDLVLVDYKMPYLNGLEVAEQVKSSEELKHIPVIMLTASPGVINLDTAEKHLIDAYLIKPFETEHLLEKIRQFIG